MKNNEIKLKVAQLLARIPIKQTTRAFCNEHKEYSNKEGVSKVSNVFNLRSVNEDIIDKLENWVIRNEW